MTRLAMRVNPLVLLLAGLAALAGSLGLRTFTMAVVAIALWIGVVIATVPSWRYPLACLALASLAAGSIVYSTWRLGGHDVTIALTAGIRILVLAWPASVAAGYLDPSRLGDYLAQSVRLPARFVVAFTAALQQFTHLHRTWRQLAATRKIRGKGPDRRPIAALRFAGSMAFGLLVSTLRGTSQTAMAMDARGFRNAPQRTWLEPARWSRLDRVSAGVVCGLGLWPLVYQVVLIAA